jgi:hypothetical protein
MSAPGWYRDPWLPTRWRYFDGVLWTAWVHPLDVAEPVVGQPEPFPPAGGVGPGGSYPMPAAGGGPVGSYPMPAAGGGPGGINSSPAAWWWASGTLAGTLIVFLGLAWLVNR